MHAIAKKTLPSSSAPAEPQAVAPQRANRVAARPHLKPRSTYPTLSVVQLKPGPLARLAWLFLNSNR